MFSNVAKASLRRAECLHLPNAPHRHQIAWARTRFSSARLYSSLPVRTRARRTFPVTGLIVAFAAGCGIYLQSSQYRYLEAPQNSTSTPLPAGASVEVVGQTDGHASDAPTGTSTVPFFPRTISLPRSPGSGGGLRDGERSAALPAGIGAASEEEYHLLGLGVRKVSLFRIEVYVVGLYVAKSDLSRLQAEMIKASVGGGATTLVQGEKDDLRRSLLNGAESEKLWKQVLKGGQVKSAVRIVPVKNTNFGHLRDGWIRGIDARGKGDEFADTGFKQSVADFKGMMGGQGSVAKGRVVLLRRDSLGRLETWVEDGAATAVSDPAKAPLLMDASQLRQLGSVDDERISRLVWMGYVAGASPASEMARENIADGVIDLVARPIGTVDTQVV